jgi:hypothetical protein
MTKSRRAAAGLGWTAVHCIYERDGDELKVCFAAFGTDRPTQFTAGPVSGHVLTAYFTAARRAGTIECHQGRLASGRESP